MSPKVYASLSGPRCFCRPHRGVSLSIHFVQKGRDRGAAFVCWNGEQVSPLFKGGMGLSKAEAWAKKELPLSPHCVMTVLERRRS